MRIGINALCFLREKAGTSNYARNLIWEISRQKTHHTFIVFVPPFARGQFPEANKIRYVYLPSGWLPLRIILEQAILPLFVLFLGIRILHSIANVAPLLLGGINIVTVHDIYYIHDPKRFGFIKRNYLRVFVRFTVWFAKRVITVSKCTKDDVLNSYLSSDKKISVIYEGAERPDDIDNVDKNDVFSSYGISSPYYLFVSTIEPGKNLLNLIRGYADLGGDYQLVVSGKWGWGYENVVQYINENALKQKVVFTGYVPDDHLTVLYKNALALVLPSFHEGFGLPTIEAMYLQCPVCCSNTKSLLEITGGAALYFDPCDIGEIRSVLSRVRDKDTREHLVQRGNENIKRFLWSECASKTLAEYDASERTISYNK